MRALVTGSTGLLGNTLVRTLIDAGHEVWALARSTEKAPFASCRAVRPAINAISSHSGSSRDCRSP